MLQVDEAKPLPPQDIKHGIITTWQKTIENTGTHMHSLILQKGRKQYYTDFLFTFNPQQYEHSQGKCKCTKTDIALGLTCYTANHMDLGHGWQISQEELRLARRESLIISDFDFHRARYADTWQPSLRDKQPFELRVHPASIITGRALPWQDWPYENAAAYLLTQFKNLHVELDKAGKFWENKTLNWHYKPE